MQNSARDMAVCAFRDRKGNVSAHLARLMVDREAPEQERALAEELALGALRRRATLEAVLGVFLDQPGKRLPGLVPEILYIALYQILFLNRVPDFAAVNEAVSQTIRSHHKRQSGLVNGVLRTVIRDISPPTVGKCPLSREVIPVGPEEYRTAKRPVFPCPTNEPAAYLAAAFSLPTVLAKRWLHRFGSPAKAVEVASHANVRAPLIVRVNRLKCDVGAAAAALAADGVASQPHENGLSLVITEHGKITSLGAFRDGLIQPQDPTATSVAPAIGVRPGDNVLDFCAAPGTKTTHLAELMDNQGTIVATDVSTEKLQRVEDNCLRHGVTIATTRLSPDLGSVDPESFDVVLADVPCSNTGVLARRAEARWRFNSETLAGLVKDQQLILSAASLFVRRGGKLLYSTCSIEPEECGELTANFLRRRSRFKLVKQKLTLPGGATDPTRWRDGGYVALFEAR